MSPRHSKRAEIEVVNTGDAALVRVQGMLDEHFPGFGDLGTASTVILDVSKIKFITSFGVRQWLISMRALPPSANDVYLVGCPRIFVDQLNMILNFGGRGQILTLLAPYRCNQCANESEELVDAVAEGPAIREGAIPERSCKKCNGRLVLDELPDVYFACLGKYGPRHVNPAATELLATDTRTLAKQVLKPQVAAPTRAQKAAAAAAATPAKGTSIVFWIVLVVLLGGLATGLYLLVGPT